MRSRLLCHLLMGFAAPAVLFVFYILFGSDSYQVWDDRFLYNLTNGYVFVRSASDTILGPLWREDTLSGNVWATNIEPAPLATHIVMSRPFQLSPFGVDLIQMLFLYFVAVIAMYLYLRRVLGLMIESAAAAAVMFASTAYWIEQFQESLVLPMAVALLPSLLVLAHQIDRVSANRRGTSPLLPVVGLSLFVYITAVHSALSAFPVALVFLFVYAWNVFGLDRSLLWILLSVGLGLLLASPFLWSVVDATRHSWRLLDPESGFLEYSLDGGAAPWLRGPAAWPVLGQRILARIAVGHNQYGINLIVILVTLVWLCLGPRWSREQPSVRRILRFVASASLVILGVEIFATDIDYVKRDIPFLGGWRMTRVQYFAFFTITALAGWMLDRSLFRSGEEDIPSPGRMTALRPTIVAVGLLGILQIGYSAYRMRLVPDFIYAQKLTMSVGLLVYAVAIFSLLVLLYRGTRGHSVTFNLVGTESTRRWCAALIILAVSLTTSIHAYRPGMIARPSVPTAGGPDQIMTYAQRYAIPEDIQAIKRLNVSDGRVVDLTRPWYRSRTGPAPDSSLLPLAGLRTLSGYNIAVPFWYDQFIRIGINGWLDDSPEPWTYDRYVIQVDNLGKTNFEALGLLDVRFILASEGSRLPGYVPVASFPSSSKTLYTIQEDSRLGPAFLSPDVQCFANDTDALKYIHGKDLRSLASRAVLVIRDVGITPLCAEREPLDSVTEVAPPRIHVDRGIDRVSIRVENNASGILTLSDTYYPWWRVFVDGVERPLLRTYTTLRGVMIEPGRHSVEFVYDPRVFHILFKLSNGLLAILLVVALVAWRRNKRATEG